jgi:hypothetical protein
MFIERDDMHVEKWPCLARTYAYGGGAPVERPSLLGFSFEKIVLRGGRTVRTGIKAR